MADEEPQPQSIQQRIAALKLSQVGSGAPPQGNDRTPKPSAAAGKARPPPPPPPKPDVPARPSAYNRPASTNNPPLTDLPNGGIGNQPEEPRPNGASANGMDGISRPILPPRTSTQSSKTSQGPKLPPRTPSGPSPSLPPRRPSEMALTRKASNESVSSIATARSSVSGMSNGTSTTSRSERYAIRAPEFNPSALPPLPAKRTAEEKQAHEQKYNVMRPAKSGSNPLSSMLRKGSTPSVPTRPQPKARPTPALPSRTGVRQEEPVPVPDETPTEPPARRLQPPPPRKSALSMGFGNPIHPPDRPSTVPVNEGAPPPIPASSKPDLAALQASKPKIGATTPQKQNGGGAGSCLHCRDFSGPDDHAARFPRQSIPSSDVGWLAHQLTSPFPSLTDKARAIFTWLHHNVAYDVEAFFNNRVKPSTPQSTLTSGLAVCEGYAGLFAALAMKAGLEAIVVSGHGKGYGHSELQPGQPLPAFNAGHAWNACRFDNGEWKLIDPCWGAGTVGGKGQPFTPGFNPTEFTKSNDDFGRTHFPSDHPKQFRNDGRVLSWEEYITSSKSGTAAKMCNGYVAEEGLTEASFAPVANPIVLAHQGPNTRFMFQKICPHWDPVRCGKGEYFVYVLHVEALDGTDRNHIPFERGDGVWWCDVDTRELGRPGQKVMIFAVSEFDGKEGRGLSVQEYRRKKGKVALMWAYVAEWELA